MTVIDGHVDADCGLNGSGWLARERQLLMNTRDSADNIFYLRIFSRYTEKTKPLPENNRDLM